MERDGSWGRVGGTGSEVASDVGEEATTGSLCVEVGRRSRGSESFGSVFNEEDEATDRRIRAGVPGNDTNGAQFSGISADFLDFLDRYEVKFGLSGRNIISEALREACKERLSNALNQAKERLRNHSLDIGSSSTSLELDCFKKYEKVGKTFYNSQIAATVRWLSSASYEQISDRLSQNSSSHDAENKPKVIESAATSSSPSPANQLLVQSVKDDQLKAKVLEKNVYEAAAVDLSHGKVDLPPIPSFSEFVYQKTNNQNRPSMGSESAPKRIAEADERKQRVHVHKKMKQ
ncbi:ATP-dependent DNA helicase Q-like 3 [Dendrobium catenatum]|uniref:ATP-dependent DNA helicase Q-like 3 n=1 Tax=Dendrobium catenatum TaxID=906689 RepID=A0A2I0VZG3_9ASPA|nr:ATP-dependent DNA helicase Q-like 3 [Dendrobium catenatum]